MAKFWDRIRELDGFTLTTLAQNHEFEIVRVTDDRIVLRPKQGSGSERCWPHKDLEALDAMLVNTEDITRQRVQSEWHQLYH